MDEDDRDRRDGMGEGWGLRHEAQVCFNFFLCDKKGPNDARRVVWALGVFLFYLFYFILITTRHESPQQPTQANAGARKPMTANEGQRRPTAANAGPQRPTAANDGQQRPTQVSEGPQQPMTANKGQRRQKGPKRRVWRCLGPRCVSFSFILFYSYYYETRKPTAANAGQQRPTQVNKGPQQPMTANEGQRRQKGPKRCRHIVWALGVFLFH